MTRLERPFILNEHYYSYQKVGSKIVVKIGVVVWIGRTQETVPKISSREHVIATLMVHSVRVVNLFV